MADSGAAVEGSTASAGSDCAHAWEVPSLPEARVDWIRVEGLPADTDAAMVARYFHRYGKVVEAFVDADGSKPFVFVRLAGDSGASTEKGRAEDAALCVDSAIRNLNQAEMGPENTIVTVVKAPVLHQLFVGNISDDTTSDELKELFAQFGTVVRVSVVENEGVALGYAFVGKSPRNPPRDAACWMARGISGPSNSSANPEFADASEAQKAAESMNFSTFKERLLRVDHADCRSKRSKVAYLKRVELRFLAQHSRKVGADFVGHGSFLLCFMWIRSRGPSPTGHARCRHANLCSAAAAPFCNAFGTATHLLHQHRVRAWCLTGSGLQGQVEVIIRKSWKSRGLPLGDARWRGEGICVRRV